MSLTLFHGDGPLAWHRFTTREFPRLASSGALCILPVVAFKEQKAGIPLDAEERLCGRYLSPLHRSPPEQSPVVILPPVRQVPLQEKGQVFTTDLETASRLVEAAVVSAVDSGFSRFCLLHAGEALTDWLDGVGRDLRVHTGASLFRIGLHSLGKCPEGIPSEAQMESFLNLVSAIVHPGEAS